MLIIIYNILQMGKNMKVDEHKQNFETTTLHELQFNNDACSSSQDYNFDDKQYYTNNNNITSRMENNVPERTPSSSILQIKKNVRAIENKQDLETVLIDGIQFNNVAIDSNKNSSQGCGTNDDPNSINGNSGSDSDDNLIYGTPNRSLAVS